MFAVAAFGLVLGERRRSAELVVRPVVFTKLIEECERTAVMDYIEVWYSRQRPNARAGMCAPAVAWAEYRKSSQATAAA